MALSGVALGMNKINNMSETFERTMIKGDNYGDKGRFDFNNWI